LATILEEGGIPVEVTQLPGERGYVVERWLAWPAFLWQQLLVPEDKVAQAQALLAQAQLEPQRRTAQEAPASPGPTPTPSLDPTVDQMRALASMAPEQREACLAQALRGWMAEGISQGKVLEYLCAAGLPAEAARGWLDRAHEERRRWEGRRRARFLQGMGALVCGGLWQIAALRAHPVELHPVDAGGVALIVVGVLLIYTALSMKPAEAGPAPEPEGEPEKRAGP
jgi:hypothetical protein